jgi:hypothetical protein
MRLVISKSMKVLVLAGILSIAAASAAQAGGKVTGSDFRASAACTERCPVLAGDGGPVGVGEGNGRSMASATTRSGHIPRLWRQAGGAASIRRQLAQSAIAGPEGRQHGEQHGRRAAPDFSRQQAQLRW